MADIQAYPLAWPAGVQRTVRRRQANFGVTARRRHSIEACTQELKRQVRLLAGTGLVISTNIKLRQDGMPYSNGPKVSDPGACVHFTRNRVPYAFPCDKWEYVEDNLWAIAKHLDAMRGTERWGVGSVEQQFLGYKALTATAGAGEDAWIVLGLEPMLSALSLAAAEREVIGAHRLLARRAHPDAGGSAEQMARINIARDSALAALKARG